jgi:hypothetical protein
LLCHPLEFVNLARRRLFYGSRFWRYLCSRLSIKLSPRQLARLLGLILKIGKFLNGLITEVVRGHELNASPIRSSCTIEAVCHLKAFLSET